MSMNSLVWAEKASNLRSLAIYPMKCGYSLMLYTIYTISYYIVAFPLSNVNDIQLHTYSRVQKGHISRGSHLQTVLGQSQSTVCIWVSNLSPEHSLGQWHLQEFTVDLVVHALCHTFSWDLLMWTPHQNLPLFSESLLKMIKGECSLVL